MTTSADRSILNQPLTLPCGVTLKNRLAKSAMSEALGTIDNHATLALANLYRLWANGGIGLAMTGNVMIDRRAIGEPGNVVVEDSQDLLILRQWAQAGTALNTQLWMQLNHPGKQSPKGLCLETVAPSAIPFSPKLQRFFAVPRALKEEEILTLIERFARSAAIAQEAGFTGVQIHGAHGYLVSQFLSPRHNQRQDAWGGTAENRQRFVLEIYRAIRRATGASFPVGIKLNSADFQLGGMTEEESLNVIRALSAENIDLIEISGGTYEAPVMAKGVGGKESTLDREAYFLAFAEQARQVTKTPLMVTGGFRSPDAMADAIKASHADLVGLARLLAIEPDAPSRLLRGEPTRHTVRPLRTGIGFVDRMALMEVAWYARQLHRLAKGKEALADENVLKAFFAVILSSGLQTWRTRRLRA